MKREREPRLSCGSPAALLRERARNSVKKNRRSIFERHTMNSNIMRAVRAYAPLCREPVLSMLHDEEVRPWYIRLKGCSVKIR